MNISEGKQEYQLQEWSGMLRERKESGLSVKDWCLEQGISEHSLAVCSSAVAEPASSDFS